MHMLLYYIDIYTHTLCLVYFVAMCFRLQVDLAARTRSADSRGVRHWT